MLDDSDSLVAFIKIICEICFQDRSDSMLVLNRGKGDWYRLELGHLAYLRQLETPAGGMEDISARLDSALSGLFQDLNQALVRSSWFLPVYYVDWTIVQRAFSSWNSGDMEAVLAQLIRNRVKPADKPVLLTPTRRGSAKVDPKKDSGMTVFDQPRCSTLMRKLIGIVDESNVSAEELACSARRIARRESSSATKIDADRVKQSNDRADSVLKVPDQSPRGQRSPVLAASGRQ